MTQLDLPTVEQIVNLVAEISDPTVDVPLPERKRRLAEGVSLMVGADVWIWSTAVAEPVRRDVMATFVLHGGWADEDEEIRTIRALTNPAINAALSVVYNAAVEGRYLTYRRDDWMTEEGGKVVLPIWNTTGFEYSMLSLFPVEGNAFSGVGFHRRQGKPDFTERDRAIVHVVFQQVEWLHRHGTQGSAGGKVLQLSPRERQVLLLLLDGNSRKEMARKLEISEHTVGDYMKSLHKHFAVNSRAELQAYFLLGKR